MNREKEIKKFIAGELSKEERVKYEIAEELGILDRILEEGWKSLSAKETGKIGGIMARRKNLKNK